MVVALVVLPERDHLVLAGAADRVDDPLVALEVLLAEDGVVVEAEDVLGPLELAKRQPYLRPGQAGAGRASAESPRHSAHALVHVHVHVHLEAHVSSAPPPPSCRLSPRPSRPPPPA